MDGTELAVGNVVRRVLHIIREEDLLLVTSDVGGLNLSAGSDDKDAAEEDNNHVAAAAAARNLLHRPSLHTLLGNMHNSACQNSFDGGYFEEKGKCIFFLLILTFFGMILKTVCRLYSSIYFNYLHDYVFYNS